LHLIDELPTIGLRIYASGIRGVWIDAIRRCVLAFDDEAFRFELGG
jgi:hypothetical protein